jgi:hypothetical protein
VVRIVELRGQEDFAARNTRGLDANADLGFVTVGGGGINGLVPVLEGMFDGLLDLSGCGFPSACEGLDYDQP